MPKMMPETQVPNKMVPLALSAPQQLMVRAFSASAEDMADSISSSIKNHMTAEVLKSERRLQVGWEAAISRIEAQFSTQLAQKIAAQPGVAQAPAVTVLMPLSITMPVSCTVQVLAPKGVPASVQEPQELPSVEKPKTLFDELTKKEPVEQKPPVSSVKARKKAVETAKPSEVQISKTKAVPLFARGKAVAIANGMPATVAGKMRHSWLKLVALMNKAPDDKIASITSISLRTISSYTELKNVRKVVKLLTERATNPRTAHNFVK
jgi:hypothetical protein